MKHVLASLTTGGCLLLAVAGTAFASGKTLQNPTTGHKGAPTNTCSAATPTPGASATAHGSPFNEESGVAGTVYAGNPGTKSLANSNSTAAVSQYDVACFQVP
jgi:hypothetical protein